MYVSSSRIIFQSSAAESVFRCPVCDNRGGAVYQRGTIGCWLMTCEECAEWDRYMGVMCCFVCVGMGILAIFGGPFFTIADKLFDFLPGRGPSYALFGTLGMVCCCFTCLCWRLYPK